ncbi:MAG: EamA family transporter [Erysipelotrichaceae bacterium]|nr:EamA family transporter [Erysipelotrichaceae bacterium]
MNNSSVQEKSIRNRAILMVLSASLCFATGGLFMKLIPWNALAINGVRNLIASAVIGIYILMTHHKLKFNPTVLIGAVSMAGVTTCYAIANKLTTAGNTIILQYTAPVWIMVMVYLFFGKKPSRTGIISLLIVFAGILCFFFEGLSTGRWLGDLIALLSGIFYAGVFMLNSFEKGDALSSVFFGQLLCGIFLTPLVFQETDFSMPVLIAVFFLGAVQVGLAYIFFTTGTKYIDPLTASIINALEPILNPVLVAIFYGEKLGVLSLAGAAIVLCGIMYYNIKEALENREKTA